MTTKERLTTPEESTDAAVDKEIGKISKQLKTLVIPELSPSVLRSIIENMVTNMLAPFIRERLDKAEIESTIHLEILRTVGPFIEGEVIATDMQAVISAAIVDQVKALLTRSVSDIIRTELGLIMDELKQQGQTVTDITRRVSHLEGQISILMNRA